MNLQLKIYNMAPIELHKLLLYDQIQNIRYCYLGDNGIVIGLAEPARIIIKDWTLFKWEPEYILIEYENIINKLIYTTR